VNHPSNDNPTVLSQAVGIMVTASHNPEGDNGLKMVDPSGGMLQAAWEVHAAAIANAPVEELGDTLAVLAAEAGVADHSCEGARVIIGRDTRASSPHLASLVAAGVDALGGEALDMGVMTTPQLHFLVAATNASPRQCEAERFGGLEPSLDSYFSRFQHALFAFLDVVGVSRATSRGMGTTVVDAADGVGGPQACRFQHLLAEALDWQVRNDGSGSTVRLNDGCGAEHVQKARAPPLGVDPAEDCLPHVTLCSLDGDADRVVFHAFETDGRWELIDGDKIAALLAVAIGALCRRAGGEVASLGMGVAQTAYANGAATRWMTGCGLDVVVAKTGVKYVHHAAEAFDVGVYFEANGHGTVLFSPRALAAIDTAADAAIDADPTVLKGTGSSLDAAAAAAVSAGKDAGAAVTAAVQAMTPAAAAVALQALSVLINPFVGDAISDALACEAVLRLGRVGARQWIDMYTDLPSRQTKVAVADRLALCCVDDESRLVAPEELQAAIDALAVAAGPSSRAFVRPSGTEDVVRVYAESATVEDADKLALDVARAVYDLAGGVGTRP
jgi:phosphoacetylglucosamine mutase